MDPRKIFSIAWNFALLITTGVCLFLLWQRPSGGGGSSASSAVVVAGESALTPAADGWGNENRECPPPPGSTAPAIKIVYKDVPQSELERLAREYAATIVHTPVTAENSPQKGSGTSQEPVSGPEIEKPTLGLSAVFGEYYGPAAPYGTRFLAGLKTDGKFETRFNILPPPKFRFIWVYGGGGFVDLSSANGQSLNVARDNRVYLFFEPFQTKRIYWRLEGGMHETPQKWEQFWGVKAEWRTDPWIPRKWRGLRTIDPTAKP